MTNTLGNAVFDLLGGYTPLAPPGNTSSLAYVADATSVIDTRTLPRLGNNPRTFELQNKDKCFLGT